MLLAIGVGILAPIPLRWGVFGLPILLGIPGFCLLKFIKPLRVSRKIQNRIGILEKMPWVLELENPNNVSLKFEIVDMLDGQGIATSSDIPWEGEIGPKQKLQLTAEVIWQKRGSFLLSPMLIRVSFLHGFWQRSFSQIELQKINVYPNYETVMRSALMTMSDMLESDGIKKRKIAGLSREFHQLRQWQEGDSFSQIDWKATSRKRDLISREFTEQRDQTLILMLDCGKNMSIMEGDISRFDNVLNAILYVGWLALRQGDRVGVLGYGEVSRWMAPTKGISQTNRLLNHLFNYEPSNYRMDWEGAVEQLLLRQKRRSLVVVATSLDQPLLPDDIRALSALRRKHKVILANLETTYFHDLTTKQNPESLEDSLTILAAWQRESEYKKNEAELKKQGICVVRTLPRDFAVSISRNYLALRETL